MLEGLIDITRTIGLDTLTYPGDSEANIEITDSYAAGDRFFATHLNMSSHTGTHLDAPAHFINGGKHLSEFGIGDFVMEALVIETGDAVSVERHHIHDASIRPGDGVLLKTRNAAIRRDCFTDDYCHISAEAARELAMLKVALVGIDYLSVDPDGSVDMPAHMAILGSGALIMEDADLRRVRPGRYRLYALPLRIAGTEAAPCRAFLEKLS